MIGAPVNLGQATQASGVATTLVITTSAAAPLGATIVGVAGESANVAISGVTDSAGNTYVVNSVADGSSRHMALFYALVGTALPVGGTITVTYASNATIQLAAACAVTGIAHNIFPDVDVQGAGNHANGTSPSISTGTLAQPAEIVFGLVQIASGASDSFTEASGFTSLTPALDGSALRWAWQIVSSTSSVTYAPSLGTLRGYVVNDWTFEGADPLDGWQQYGWPNPRAAAPPRHEVGANALGPAMLGQNPFPGRLWPNPAAPAWRAAEAGGRELALYASIRPFTQSAWPNPRLSSWRGGEAGARSMALQASVRPFGQAEWPNPAPVRRFIHQPGGLWQALLVVARPAPFAQSNWPNPRARRGGFPWPAGTTGAHPVIVLGDGTPVGVSAAVTLTMTGLSAGGTCTFAGTSDDPWPARDLAVGAGLDLATGTGFDLAVSAGLRFTGRTASISVPGSPANMPAGPS